jgi:hypothetical protein
MHTNRAPAITSWMASARRSGRSILWADDVYLASLISDYMRAARMANHDKPLNVKIDFSSPLSQAFIKSYDFRRTLLSMLRPMDIVALVMAIGIGLARFEVNKYMVPWKQLFYDLRWVDELEKNDCTATLFGTSINELGNTIHHWDYTFNTTHMKFLVVVGQPRKHIWRIRFALSWHIPSYFDTEVAWYHIPSFAYILSALSTSELLGRPDTAEACILFLEKGMHCDLDSSWFSILSSRIGPLQLCKVGPRTPFPGSTELWRTESQRLKNVEISNAYDLVYTYQPVDPARLQSFVARVSCSQAGEASIVLSDQKRDIRSW